MTFLKALLIGERLHVCAPPRLSASVGCARFCSSLCWCSLPPSRLDAPCVGQFAGNCAYLFRPKPLQGNLAWAPFPSSSPRDTQMFALCPSPATIFILAPDLKSQAVLRFPLWASLFLAGRQNKSGQNMIQETDVNKSGLNRSDLGKSDPNKSDMFRPI